MGIKNLLDQIKRMRRNYKPETWLYVALFIASLTIIGLSFRIPQTDRWFTIVAGFGCSGIASVIVAWLVEKAACRHKEKANNELLDHMFEMLDIELRQALELLLETYARRDMNVNIERAYSLKELSEMISKAEKNLGIWDWYYKKIGNAYSSVDTTSLLYDPISQHNQLYSIIHMAQGNYKAYQDMAEKLDKDSMNSFSHIFICNAIDFTDDFFALRNKQIGIAIRDDTKEFINTYRIAAEKKNEKRHDESK